VPEDDDAPAPQQTRPARTQVASAGPQPILPPAVARQQQPKERLQWQTGPAAANAPQEPSDETTSSTALAFVNPNERNSLAQTRTQLNALAAVPLVSGAHQIAAGFARADGPRDMKHPENVRGFAAPVRAMVENRFVEFAPSQPAASFQRDRAPVVVVGFEATRTVTATATATR
jgi:hypothetical protein